MIIYDHLITISEEINALWRRKKSLATCALLVNRYALLVLGVCIMVLTFPFDQHMSVKFVRFCFYSFDDSLKV